MLPGLEHVDRLAADILIKAGVDDWATVDVDVVAAELDITVALTRRGPDGCFMHSDEGGSRIFLNQSPPEVRRRFTLAHELAHWAVNVGLDDAASTSSARIAFRSEEVLCNQVAGALLLPARWLAEARPWLESTDRETLSEVRDVAREAHASLEATIVRLQDRCGWTSTILHWKRRQHRRPGQPAWRLIGEAGIYHERSSAVMPLPETADQLDWAAAQSTSIQTDQALLLRIDGVEQYADCDLLLRGDDAVALIRNQDMPTRDSPIDALKDALVAAFWFKRDLLRYVEDVVGPDSPLLLGIPWLSADTPKTQSVAALVDRLVVQQSRDPRPLLRVLARVSAMERFPQLEQLEDATRRIARAQAAVLRLRRAVRVQPELAAAQPAPAIGHSYG